ncbi:MAG: hypothetical protein ACREPF_08270 [Rhodanobacteraceae bacterium]
MSAPLLMLREPQPLCLLSVRAQESPLVRRTFTENGSTLIDPHACGADAGLPDDPAFWTVSAVVLRVIPVARQKVRTRQIAVGFGGLKVAGNKEFMPRSQWKNARSGVECVIRCMNRRFA